MMLAYFAATVEVVAKVLAAFLKAADAGTSSDANLLLMQSFSF